MDLNDIPRVREMLATFLSRMQSLQHLQQLRRLLVLGFGRPHTSQQYDHPRTSTHVENFLQYD